MYIPTIILGPDQSVRPAGYHVASLEEAALKEPEGVYTITRTFNTDQAVLLDAHFDRLNDSARMEGMKFELDRPALRAALRGLIAQAGHKNSRFRITIPRSTPEEIHITLEALREIAPEVRQQGVKVATLSIARSNPRAKTNQWVLQRDLARSQIPAEVFDGFIVNEKDEILEGFSANFYALMGGTLYTAEDDILHGISRRITLNAAEEVAMPVSLRPITLDEVPSLQEAFLTSSGRGIVPIVAMDGIQIGNGKPGPATLQLAGRYEEWITKNLEPI
jgi:branched-chain amino acid aminotransferase